MIVLGLGLGFFFQSILNAECEHGPLITHIHHMAPTPRGEYIVENLKLSRDRHENCKTHPKGNFYLFIYFSITKELVRFFT